MSSVFCKSGIISFILLIFLSFPITSSTKNAAFPYSAFMLVHLVFFAFCFFIYLSYISYGINHCIYMPHNANRLKYIIDHSTCNDKKRNLLSHSRSCHFRFYCCISHMTTRIFMTMPTILALYNPTVSSMHTRCPCLNI